MNFTPSFKSFEQKKKQLSSVCYGETARCCVAFRNSRLLVQMDNCATNAVSLRDSTLRLIAESSSRMLIGLRTHAGQWKLERCKLRDGVSTNGRRLVHVICDTDSRRNCWISEQARNCLWVSRGIMTTQKLYGVSVTEDLVSWSVSIQISRRLPVPLSWIGLGMLQSYLGSLIHHTDCSLHNRWQPWQNTWPWNKGHFTPSWTFDRPAILTRFFGE